MDSIVFLLSLSYLLIVILTGALVYLYIELKAMQKSTHQVSYVDPWSKELKKHEQDFESLNEETVKALKKDPFDNIA